MIKTVNLKQDMPSLEEARKRLSAVLADAKQRKCVALKLIHGYGSGGTGGVLKDGIRASLRKRRKKGEIAAFVAGENFSMFDETTRRLIEVHPQLGKDSDLDRGNEGISIAILSL